MDDVNYPVDDSYFDDQGNKIITIDSNLTKGVHKVDVKFVNDKNEFDVITPISGSKYTVEEVDSFGFKSSTISVLGITSLLTAPSVVTTYNIANELVATLTDVDGNVLANKPINIVVGTINKILNTTSDGQVSVDISTLVPGSYVAYIAFAGDNQYDESNTTANVVVNKGVSDVTISYDGDLVPGEKLIIKAEMPGVEGNVTIIVNGDKNTTELVNNVATYTIDKLAAGTYYVTVLYAGNDLFDFAYKTDSFDVVKSTADLINELNDTIKNQTEQIDDLTIQLNETQANATKLAEDLDVANGKVDDLTVQLNETQANATKLAEDLAELNQTVADKDAEITNLNNTVKTQNSTIESQKALINNLNETIVEQNKTINKTSNPIATSILVKDITTTATTAKYFTISLIDANNNPLANKTITYAVNGKTDSVITNGSGIATVKVSYNTAGTRYYTFSFLGEVGYSASIATAKVVVNKKATKITAPKKTFKVKTKTKKVQVKLTSGKTVLKSKKVTLKVKGKTYIAKTNKKGIVTFKITKLTKKGTFKYNVKFAGDKAYKAVNKNGKITIK